MMLYQVKTSHRKYHFGFADVSGFCVFNGVTWHRFTCLDPREEIRNAQTIIIDEL